MTIENLKNWMCIPADADSDKINNAFDQIAQCLKEKCVIRFEGKGYRILDFEFYYYNTNHRDITVHPRNAEALTWYINDFGGIDLNFKSDIEKVEVRTEKKNNTYVSYKYTLTDRSFFGGILIRRIQRIDDKYIFDGPLKVSELFRVFSAADQHHHLPVLEISESPLESIGFKQCTRHNLLGSHKGVDEEEIISKKVEYNISQCFTEVDPVLKSKLKEELKDFKGKLYRYCWGELS
ncbi:MAG: hypothetical protein IKA45_00145 [Bacteroidales bacterium]|nr:hypothetical protein [Bacteroidales bacterium]